MSKETAQAIRDTMISPNVPDANLEPANLVDVLDGIGRAIRAGLKNLGAGDHSSPMGAVEFHAVKVGEAGGKIAESLDRVAEAIGEAASALNNIASAIGKALPGNQ